jgi:iron complex transport system permease protein
VSAVLSRDPVTPASLAADRALVRSSRTSGRARAVLVSVALAAAGLLSFCVSVSVGDFPIPLSEVPAAILGWGSPDAGFIVHELRLPRALTAVLVGAAFGLSGAIFQSLARNPLASPDIIGITAGASTAAVFVIVVLHQAGVMLSVGALAGALLTAVAIYLLAWKRGVSSYRLVLVGIGISAVLGAVTSYLLTRADIYEAQRAAVWLTGSLNGRGWEHVEPLAWAMLGLAPATVLLTRSLRVLQLGDDTAKGLGVPVELSRAALVLVGVALASVATAAAGPVAFVAFVSAPVARRLVNAPLTVVPAGLAGAVLLLLSDVVGRRLFAPTELPVGIITGIIGAPYLIWLLARANRIGAGG